MHSKYTANWGELRTQGMGSYILTQGVLRWGVSTGVLFAIMFPFTASFKVTFLDILPLSLLLFALGGIAWGYAMWVMNERSYRQSREDEPSDEPDADGQQHYFR